jgi:hypothetical protein
MVPKPNRPRNGGNSNAGTNAGTAGTEIDAYTYLRGIWNNSLEPTHVRLRAAAIGIEFERPRLAVSAIIDNSRDIATLLDQRLKRIEQMKLLEAKTIDATVIEPATVPPSPPPLPSPLNRIYLHREVVWVLLAQF